MARRGKEKGEERGKNVKLSHESALLDDGALWMSKPEDVTNTVCSSFCRSLSNDREDLVPTKHFRVEGPTRGPLQFMPRRGSVDLFETQHDIRLFVRSAFIMDVSEALIQKCLNFVLGHFA